MGERGLSTGQLQVALEPLDGSIFMLTLNRPDARNAIGRQFLRELKESLDNLVLERSTRCVIIKSSVSRVFCAGADLKVGMCAGGPGEPRVWELGMSSGAGAKNSK